MKLIKEQFEETLNKGIIPVFEYQLKGTDTEVLNLSRLLGTEATQIGSYR